MRKRTWEVAPAAAVPEFATEPEKLKVLPATKVPLTARLCETKSGLEPQMPGPLQTPLLQVSGLVQALLSSQVVLLVATQPTVLVLSQLPAPSQPGWDLVPEHWFTGILQVYVPVPQ
jgi:hypothetical protein